MPTIETQEILRSFQTNVFETGGENLALFPDSEGVFLVFPDNVTAPELHSLGQNLATALTEKRVLAVYQETSWQTITDADNFTQSLLSSAKQLILNRDGFTEEKLQALIKDYQANRSWIDWPVWSPEHTTKKLVDEITILEDTLRFPPPVVITSVNPENIADPKILANCFNVSFYHKPEPRIPLDKPIFRTVIPMFILNESIRNQVLDVQGSGGSLWRADRMSEISFC